MSLLFQISLSGTLFLSNRSRAGEGGGGVSIRRSRSAQDIRGVWPNASAGIGVSGFGLHVTRQTPRPNHGKRSDSPPVWGGVATRTPHHSSPRTQFSISEAKFCAIAFERSHGGRGWGEREGGPPPPPLLKRLLHRPWPGVGCRSDTTGRPRPQIASSKPNDLADRFEKPFAFLTHHV